MTVNRLKEDPVGGAYGKSHAEVMSYCDDKLNPYGRESMAMESDDPSDVTHLQQTVSQLNDTRLDLK